MAPVKPGQRAVGSNPTSRNPEDAEKDPNEAENPLSFIGLPHAMWVSARYAKGLQKQAEILKRKLRDKAGGNEVEMENLERRLLMTENELDLEQEHFQHLDEMRQELNEEDDFLDLNDEVKNIREGPEFNEFWEAMNEIKGGAPAPLTSKSTNLRRILSVFGSEGA